MAYVGFDLDETIGEFDAPYYYLFFLYPKIAYDSQASLKGKYRPSAALQEKLEKTFDEFAKCLAKQEPQLQLLRPGIVDILKKFFDLQNTVRIPGTLQMCIYSNNGHLELLMLAQKMLEELVGRKHIFCKLIPQVHDIRKTNWRGGDRPIKSIEVLKKIFADADCTGGEAISPASIPTDKIFFFDDKIHPDIQSAIPQDQYFHVTEYTTTGPRNLYDTCFLDTFNASGLAADNEYKALINPVLKLLKHELGKKKYGPLSITTTPIEKVTPEEVTAHIRDFLKEAMQEYAARNRLFINDTQKILDALERKFPVPKKESIDFFMAEQAKEEESMLQLQATVKEIFAKKGPLCDSEGFYQHSGECWSDAIQQVMNNTDGLKEVVQKKFIEKTFSLNFVIPKQLFEEARTKLYGQKIAEGLLSTVAEEYNTAELELLESKWAILYLREAQQRFLRHYLAESERRTVREETCKTAEPAEIAREKIQAISKSIRYRKGGKEGELSSLFGQIDAAEKRGIQDASSRPVVDIYEEYADLFAGGGLVDISILLTLYKYLYLGLDFGFDIVTEAKQMLFFNYSRDLADEGKRMNYIENLTAVFLGMRNINTNAGHLAAFYTCGGEDLFYEDNFGIVPFKWREFFLTYFNAKVIPEGEQSSYKFENLLHGKYEQNARIAFVACEKGKAEAFKRITKTYPVLVLKNETNPTEKPTIQTMVDDTMQSLVVGENTFPTKDGELLKILVPEALVDSTKSSKNQELRVLTHLTLLYKKGFVPSAAANLGFKLNKDARLKIHPILSAIKEGTEEEVIEKLREPSVPVSTLDSAPFFAIRYEKPKIIEALLQANKLNLEYQTTDGFTPLAFAMQENKPALVDLLLTKGANAKGLYQDKPVLYFAILSDTVFGTTSYTAKLLEKGADINAKIFKDYTALALALALNNKELIQFLCSKGADAGSLLELAKKQGRSQEIQDVLASCTKTSGGAKKFPRQTRKHRHT